MAVSSFFLLSSIGTILSVFLIFINTIAIFFSVILFLLTFILEKLSENFLMRYAEYKYSLVIKELKRRNCRITYFNDTTGRITYVEDGEGHSIYVFRGKNAKG